MSDIKLAGSQLELFEHLQANMATYLEQIQAMGPELQDMASTTRTPRLVGLLCGHLVWAPRER